MFFLCLPMYVQLDLSLLLFQLKSLFSKFAYIQEASPLLIITFLVLINWTCTIKSECPKLKMCSILEGTVLSAQQMDNIMQMVQV